MTGKITTNVDVFKLIMAAIDPSFDIKEETFDSISVIAKLVGHSTARERSQQQI